MTAMEKEGSYSPIASYDDEDEGDHIYPSPLRASSSSFADNADTLPRSNTKKKKHSRGGGANSSSGGGAVLELSSLFRSETATTSNLSHGQWGAGDDANDTDDNSDGTPPRGPPKRRQHQLQNSTLSTQPSSGSTSPDSTTPLQPTPTRLTSIINQQRTHTKNNNGNDGVWGGFNNMMRRSSWKTLGSIREEGSDDEDEDPIMEVMDFLEDEIDEHTYDELIPLQIRMALEDQVFGWDHFFSNILGHVVYTVGSYLLTFWIITFIVLHEVPWGKHSEGGSPWGMPHGVFSFIRSALSIGSGISTFRTIRRRRRVWLRHPAAGIEAGSREFQRRQSQLEEADRRAQRFVLGSKLWAKMQRSYMKRRDKYLARGVHRKLLKAQRMFERRHRNRAKLIRSTSASNLIDSGPGKKNRAVASALARHGHESSHHERVRMLAAAPGSAGSIRKTNTFDSDDYDGDRSVGGSSLGDSADYQSSYHSSMPQQGSEQAMDSHTLPNFAMESVSHDQMPFAHGEIKKIPYVHGGFFGAAPFMLTNPHWIAILRILMPDVYVEISRRASYAPAPRLIHWAENNPVVAAYGTAHEIEFSGRVPTLEWDVFLDPYLIRRVEIVLSEKEAFLQRQKDARKKYSEHKRAENRIEGENGKIDEVPASPHSNAPPVSTADERLVLLYYDKEIKRRTTILVERMLIAHGNLAQLMLEQTGYLKKYNFSRVKRTRKTLGGGIFARQWLSIYSEAMKLGLGYEDDIDDEVSDSGTDGSLEEREDVDFANFEDVPLNDGDDNQSRKTSPDSKSATHSMDAAIFRTPTHDRPPRKIVMMRDDNDTDDGMSTDGEGSINSETKSEPSPLISSSRTSKTSGSRRRRRRRMPTPPLERQVDVTSLRNLSASPDRSMAESISILKPIMKCYAPFGLLLDIKSRHVPRRVWALIVDYLRDCGARVEGIASFIVEEVRDISQYCHSSVNEIVFIHSAGDMQHGCHNGQIKRGDRVFFNAGSLLWDYPSVYDADTVRNILWHRFQPWFDEQSIKEGYRLKPYAKTWPDPKTQTLHSESESETCDESTLGDGDSMTEDLFTRLLLADSKKKSLSELDFAFEEAFDGICSTIQQYKEYYHLSIGLYVQEFAIDEVAIGLIVKYVNLNLHVYDLGLSWGGINGLTVKGIQPGRFTATDGLWNQRYGGMPWRYDLKPTSAVSQ